jgi:hypothetical protein
MKLSREAYDESYLIVNAMVNETEIGKDNSVCLVEANRENTWGTFCLIYTKEGKNQRLLPLRSATDSYGPIENVILFRLI